MVPLKTQYIITALVWLLVACMPRHPNTASIQAIDTQSVDQQTAISIQKMLNHPGGSIPGNTPGNTIDYDTLIKVYQTLYHCQRPVAHMNQLLDQLIQKRHSDPRIDQMVLIIAAKIIGSSRYPITEAPRLFKFILQQEERLNEWVLAFVAEAVGDYLYPLPNGDELVDSINLKLDQLQSKDRSQEEHFGFHFLPPPKTEFIQNYISSIKDQRSRQNERNRYYFLIKNKLTEKQIVFALKYLQHHGAPYNQSSCEQLMECLIRHRQQLPFK